MVNPTGSALVSLANGDLGIFERSTSSLEIIDSSVVLTDIAGDDDNQLFGSTFTSLYEIDSEDGSSTFVGRFGTSINALGYDSTGQLYGAGGSGFYSIDTATGDATLISNTFGFRSSGDIVFDETNNWFWATSASNGADTLFRITLDGTFTQLGNIGFDEVFGLTLDPQGELVGYTSSGEEIVINTTTGAGLLSNSVMPLPASIFGATEYIAPTEASGFTGSELQLQIFSPNLQTPIITPTTAIVNSGVEFSSPYASQSSRLVEHTIDIDTDSIFYQIDSSTRFSRFADGSFNGYVLSDISDTLPAITNVAIDTSATTLGIDSSDIRFTENQIFANVEGIAFAPGDTLKLDVSFINDGSSTTGMPILGTSAADVLAGTEGDDVIQALAGNDTILSSPASDILDGGSGVDTVNYLALAGGIAANLATGVATASGTTKTDTLIGIENIIGTSSSDRLIGDRSNNSLVGGSGADVLKGGAGIDSLRGGSGRDRLVGGSGNDDLNGDGGRDILRGGRGRDQLLGGGGRDILQGGGGRDTLTGGGGADVFVVGPRDGLDIIADFSARRDRIDLKGGVRFGNLTFTERGDDVLIRTGRSRLLTVENVSAAALTEDVFI